MGVLCKRIPVIVMDALKGETGETELWELLRLSPECSTGRPCEEDAQGPLSEEKLRATPTSGRIGAEAVIGDGT